MMLFLIPTIFIHRNDDTSEKKTTY